MIQARDLSHKISVVMITRDRKLELRNTLQRLLDGPAVPIIVVDNHSRDGTATMLRRDFPSVTVIPLKENAGAIGRNIGVEYATTPYVAFCDDDSWWEPDAFARAVQVFEEYPQVGAIAGTLLVNDEARLDYVSFLHSISPLVAGVPMPGRAILSFLGCGVFVRRQAYLEVGGYNPKIKFSAEEWLLGIDLITGGWGITYIDDIVGHHHPSNQRQMNRRYQLGARNGIWATWLRRPWRAALRKTAAEITRAFKDRNQAIGLMESISGIPYVIRHRRVIPAFLEQQVQLLERQDRMLSGALRQNETLQIPVLAGAPG